MKRFVRIFLSWVIIFSVAIFGIFYFNSKKANKIPDDISSIEEAEGEITFLMMGVDAKDGESTKGQRTDTLMLCKYVADTNKLAILSIPRDTLVDIPGYGEDKINHAHAYGGPELAVESVNELLGTDVEYYVRIDYDVVKDVVDAIDGVDINVPIDMYYEDPWADPPLVIDLKQGEQTLDGKESLQFLRFRSGYATQDLGRIESQQAFIKSVIKKAQNPKYLIKIPSVFKSTRENIETNIPLRDIVTYAMDVKNLKQEGMQMATLPNESVMMSGVSYVIPIEEVKDELMEKMFSKKEIVSIDDTLKKGLELSYAHEAGYYEEYTDEQ